MIFRYITRKQRDYWSTVSADLLIKLEWQKTNILCSMSEKSKPTNQRSLIIRPTTGLVALPQTRSLALSEIRDPELDRSRSRRYLRAIPASAHLSHGEIPTRDIARRKKDNSLRILLAPSERNVHSGAGNAALLRRKMTASRAITSSSKSCSHKAVSAMKDFDPKEWLVANTGAGKAYDFGALDQVLWFTLIWNRLEVRICDRQASMKTIDKKVVEANDSGLLTWVDFEGFWIGLNGYLAEVRTLVKLKYFLLSDTLPNTKEEDRVTKLFPVLLKEKPDLVTGIQAMLFIAYRVRNNLFHGEKCVTSLPRQRPLFQILNAMIAKYIDVSTATVEHG
jgi:hypothetical protein